MDCSNYFSNIKLTLLSVIMLFFCFPSVHAYEAHLGIPTPWVDPDIQTPSKPSDWSSEIPGFYYVDYSGGSDSMHYGTPDSPRRTIPNPVPAGSYVLVDGVYSNSTGGVIKILGNGTSGEWIPNSSGPVWIVGSGGENRAEFTGYKINVTGAYVYLDNMYIHSGGRFQVGSYVSGETGHHVMLRNSEVEGLPSDISGAIVAIVGSSADQVDHVIIYNSVFHDTGNINSTTDDDAGIVSTTPYTSYVWILNNTMYNSSGSGVQINATGEPASTHHIYVGQNHIYNARQSGLWVKNATDIIFSENTIHDIITTSWSPSKGMGAQYRPQRLWMINNTVYNVEYGIRTGSTYAGSDWEIYIVGNLIYDAHAPGAYKGGSWDEACIHLQGGVYRYIYNNTLVNCDAGINLSSTEGSNYIRNNLIVNITQNAGQHINVEYQKDSTIIDNNLFYQNGNDIKIKWGSSSYDLTSFAGNTDQCDDCANENPQFVSELNAKYKLETGSPAIDAGIDTGIYEKFKSLYGIAIDKDLNGMSRFQGASIDVGAFEWQTGPATNTPSPLPPQLFIN